MELADVMALNGNNGMNGMWNNPFIYLIWLAFFGGGFGGFGFGGRDQYATAAEVRQVNDTQTLINKLDGIGQGICDSTYALTNAINQGNSSLSRDVIGGFSNVAMQLNNLGYQQQQCCCGIERSIDALKAENYRNTCEITTTIHNEGEQTRALIQANTMQALRDKLADKDRDLLYYKIKDGTATTAAA